jgi:cytochrome bd ubiquinol oxidase subunit II
LVFAVFPAVYATVLSGFYLLVILTFVGLIMRSGALGLYYSRVPAARWWTVAFTGGSIIAGFFLGLITGNLVRGVSLGADGEFAGSLGGLFNPFAIVVALFALTVFANQGAAWAALKTTGDAHRLARMMRRQTGWVVLGAFAVVTLLAALIVPEHARALVGRGLGWVMVAFVVGGLAVEQTFGWRGRALISFLGACAVVAGLVGIWAVGVYPAIVPARAGTGDSLTIPSAAAPHASLIAMVVVAAIGIPLAAVCFIAVYRTFRGRRGAAHERGHEGY